MEFIDGFIFAFNQFGLFDFGYLLFVLCLGIVVLFLFGAVLYFFMFILNKMLH